MYFITIDANNTVTQLLDGSSDYVHRITGDPLVGARELPSGAIRVSEACAQLVSSRQFPWEVVWNGTSCELAAIAPRANREGALIKKEIAEFVTTRLGELSALSDVDFDVLATSKGV